VAGYLAQVVSDSSFVNTAFSFPKGVKKSGCKVESFTYQKLCVPTVSAPSTLRPGPSPCTAGRQGCLALRRSGRMWLLAGSVGRRLARVGGPGYAQLRRIVAAPCFLSGF